MKEDSTFLLSESIGWVVDWEHPRLEMCRDSRTGGTYGKVTYTVTKDPGHDWMVCLEVHYESYVNRHGRKRRTDVMPFRNGQNGYTNHFRQNIAFFMSGYGMTLSRCASICHTTPAIVKDVDKARLSSLAGDMRPRHHSSHLAVDEFLIEHGHRYCTIVIDADTGELLYLEKGKRKEQLLHFFQWVGDDFMSHVEAIAMDMNANYSQAVKERYPSPSSTTHSTSSSGSTTRSWTACAGRKASGSGSWLTSSPLKAGRTRPQWSRRKDVCSSEPASSSLPTTGPLKPRTS